MACPIRKQLLCKFDIDLKQWGYCMLLWKPHENSKNTNLALYNPIPFAYSKLHVFQFSISNLYIPNKAQIDWRPYHLSTITLEYMMNLVGNHNINPDTTWLHKNFKFDTIFISILNIHNKLLLINRYFAIQEDTTISCKLVISYASKFCTTTRHQN